jgi:hypothetical protein
MDVSDASYYVHENNKNKGSQMGHTKEIFFQVQQKKMMIMFHLET